MSKDIVLFSGGLDSTTLLWSRRPNVKALLVDYGQRHRRELYRAQNICDTFRIEYSIADLKGIQHLIAAGSQSGKEDVPLGRYDSEVMKITIVPNRNAIMLSIAAGWAVATKCTDIFFAAHAGDHTIYPDCRPEFVEAMDSALALGNEWSPVHIHAPFVYMTKAEIVTLGASLEVPFQLTYSCYNGRLNHCGKCGTCVERREAFREAGVKDPTDYEVES